MRKIFFPRCYFILFSLFIFPFSLSAFDFGLITNQYFGFGNRGTDEDVFTYQSDILPRISFLIGDNAEFFMSAGFTLGYENELYYVPELLRTEFFMRFDFGRIRAGRIFYADPLSFIADGLFDGLQFSHYSAAGTFSVGAWYTGLLYKKNARITITEKEQEAYDAVLDYGDFIDTYFAPPRLLAAVDWEHPSVGELLRLKGSVIGQFDLSGEDVKFHSQYLVLKAGVPVKNFLFELGGSLQTSQSAVPEEDGDNRFALAFAWNAGVFWTLPTSFNSRLSLTGNFAGGRTDDLIRAFVPVTTESFGNILDAKLSGLTVIGLNYTARFIESLGAGLDVSCFVRNDLGTYKGYPLVEEDDDENYYLGTEVFARLVWSPFSDLQLNLGGGVFLPSPQTAPDGNAMWRVELTAIIAVF